MSERTALDYNFKEFVNWSVGHITLGIGKGDSLKDLVYTVVDHALRNRQFGTGQNRDDFAGLLTRYMAHVGEQEGTYFLGKSAKGSGTLQKGDLAKLKDISKVADKLAE